MGGNVSEEHEASISAAKKEAAGFSETLALSNYHTTYHIPHGCNLHGHPCKSLDSDIFTASVTKTASIQKLSCPFARHKRVREIEGIVPLILTSKLDGGE